MCCSHGEYVNKKEQKEQKIVELNPRGINCARHHRFYGTVVGGVEQRYGDQPCRTIWVCGAAESSENFCLLAISHLRLIRTSGSPHHRTYGVRKPGTTVRAILPDFPASLAIGQSELRPGIEPPTSRSVVYPITTRLSYHVMIELLLVLRGGFGECLPPKSTMENVMQTVVRVENSPTYVKFTENRSAEREAVRVLWERLATFFHP